MKRALSGLVSGITLLVVGCSSSTIDTPPAAPQALQFADSHFHPSNYAYQGVSLKSLLSDYLSASVVRSVVMPLPLQQRWDSFENYQVTDTSGRLYGANYYIGPKADLYYYAFADAMYAREYLQLSAADQGRLDLMITGFNPMDRYGAQHIKRVLLTFPGAFAGIGEFTVHKELVSRKIAGETIRSTATVPLPPDLDKKGTMSLYAQSLADLLKVAEETGLVVTLHNDLYQTEVNYDGTVEAIYPDRTYEAALKHLCSTAPQASVIWAHTGLGRYVKPTSSHLKTVARILDSCPAWVVDISWDLVQESIIHPGPGMPPVNEWIGFFNQYSSRVLWGSDTVMFSKNTLELPDKVVPGQRLTVEQYLALPELIRPLFSRLPPDVAEKISHGNYVRLFDEARRKVRAWEASHAQDDVWDLAGPSAAVR